MHIAAFQGDAECAHVLLAAGAQHSALDRLGLTPLHWAVLKRRAAVARLLQATAGARAAPTPGGMSPLMLACAAGSEDVASALLDAGAPPTQAGLDGLTAADLARALNHRPIARLLERRGAHPAAAAALPPTWRAPRAALRTVTVDELAAEPAAWGAAYARSTPLLVRGLGAAWADGLRGWDAAEFGRRWGDRSVQV